LAGVIVNVVKRASLHASETLLHDWVITMKL